MISPGNRSGKIAHELMAHFRLTSPPYMMRRPGMLCSPTRVAAVSCLETRDVEGQLVAQNYPPLLFFVKNWEEKLTRRCLQCRAMAVGWLGLAQRG